MNRQERIETKDHDWLSVRAASFSTSMKTEGHCSTVGGSSDPAEAGFPRRRGAGPGSRSRNEARLFFQRLRPEQMVIPVRNLPPTVLPPEVTYSNENLQDF